MRPRSGTTKRPGARKRALAIERQYGGATVKPLKLKKKPAPAFAPTLPRAFEPQQRQARKKTRRSERLAPERAAPSLPTMRYTPKQRQAANELLKRSVRKQTGGSRDARQTAAVLRSLLRDSRTRNKISGFTQEGEREAQRRLAQRGRRATLVTGPGGPGGPKIPANLTKSSAAQIGLELAGRDTVKAGKKKSIGFGAASIQYSPAAARSVMGALTSLENGDIGPREFVEKTAADLKTLGTAPFVASVELTKAGAEAAKGNTGPLKKLVTEAAKETYKTYRHPIQSFEEHPLLTPLAFAGAAGAGGRTAGAVARGAGKEGAGGVRGRLAEAGDTRRSPIALSDDAAAVKGGAYIDRSHSKDLGRKGGQKQRDSRRQKLTDKDGNVVTVDVRGKQMPVLKAREGELKGAMVKQTGRGGRAGLTGKRADFQAGRTQASVRRARVEADQLLDRTGSTRIGARVRGKAGEPRVKGRRAKDAVALVAEGVVRSERTWELDLRKHRARLEREHKRREQTGGWRDTGERDRNRERVAQITALLDDPLPLAQIKAVVAEGKSFARDLTSGEKPAVRSGVLSNAERAKRARLMSPAIEHLGARHDVDPKTGRQLEQLRSQRNAIEASPPSKRREARIAKLQRQIDALKATGSLRGPKGQKLSTSEIERSLRSIGLDPDEVAFLSHSDKAAGRSNYFQGYRPGQRPTLDKPGKRRTGEQYRKGATVANREVLRDAAARQKTNMANAEQLDRLVASGIIRPDGKHFTDAEAIETARRLAEEGGEQLVPVRAFGARLSEKVRNDLKEEKQGSKAMESLQHEMLNSRIVHAPDKATKPARNVVLLPKKQVDQLMRQAEPTGDVMKAASLLNTPFRWAVLPTFRWLLGNAAEPMIRLTTVGSGFNLPGMALDLRAATKAIKEMEASPDPKMRAAAREIRAQQFGGLYIGGGEARKVRKNLEDYPLAEEVYGKAVSKLPAVEQAADITKFLLSDVAFAPLKWFFHANKVIESTAQRAAFGKQFRRDLQEFTGSWTQTLKLEQKAVAEASKGLVNTPTQHRFMEEQHKLLGKYEGFGPVLRRWVQGPTPFLPWALNAARFIYWTMPMERTVQTSALVAVNQAVEKDWQERHKNVPPGSLKFALPREDGGWVDLARYTPWGLATAGPEETLINQFVPQATGPIKTLKEGEDPFGRPLEFAPEDEQPDGKPSLGQRGAVAINQLAEALIPYAGLQKRIRERGATGYSGSSNIINPRTKPNTDYFGGEGQDLIGGIDRAVNPIRPIYLSPPKKTSSEKKRKPKTRKRTAPSTQDQIDQALRTSAGVRSTNSATQDEINRALVQAALGR